MSDAPSPTQEHLTPETILAAHDGRMNGCPVNNPKSGVKTPKWCPRCGADDDGPCWVAVGSLKTVERELRALVSARKDGSS